MMGLDPASKEDGQGSPLFRPRMAREPGLRHHPPDLSRAVGQTARHGRGDRGARTTNRVSECILRRAQLRRRDEPVELRADQPASAQADDRDRGENLLKGLANMLNDIAAGQMTQTKAGAFEVGKNLAMTPGKVDPRDSALPADPVHADDRQGAGNAAGGLPAVDQPLLHPRPHAREKLRQMVRRPGRQPVHGQLEVGRREHRRR